MIGTSFPRPSAMAKATGTAMFGADIRMPGALEIAVVRSLLAHARIRGIDTSVAEAMPGVAGVMTAKDIRGTNRLKYQVADRPILCDTKVRTLGDAVAIVAAETKAQALAAAEAVRVDYEALPVLDSPAAALAGGAPRVHDDTPNLCYSQPIRKGDPVAAFAASACEVTAAFKTQLVHQAPTGARGEPRLDGGRWRRRRAGRRRAGASTSTSTCRRSRRPSAGRRSATRSRSRAGSSGSRSR